MNYVFRHEIHNQIPTTAAFNKPENIFVLHQKSNNLVVFLLVYVAQAKHCPVIRVTEFCDVNYRVESRNDFSVLKRFYSVTNNLLRGFQFFCNLRESLVGILFKFRQQFQVKLVKFFHILYYSRIIYKYCVFTKKFMKIVYIVILM